MTDYDNNETYRRDETTLIHHVDSTANANERKDTTSDTEEIHNGGDVMKEDDSNGKRKWLCVLGCAIAHFVLGGFERSNGVLYLHIQRKFGETASDIAWVISLSVTLKLLFGPIAGVLCAKFSPRCVVISGALLFSIGVLASAYASHFVLLYLTYGVLTGIGKSLAYQPGLVVVGQHFAKRRAVAVGLATAGGGIGTLVLPPLFEMWLENYGYPGGLLVISAIALHLCISGMLYYSPTKSKLNTQSLISHSCERVHNTTLLKSSDISECQMLEIEETSSKNESEKYHKLWISKCLRSCHSFMTKKSKKKKLDLNLLKRLDFVLFCIGIGFLALSFNSMMVFIPPLADSRGLSGVEGAYVMSVAGVFDTVGRIASGFILNLKRLRQIRKIIYNVVMFLLAFIIFSLPHIVTFVEFCIVAGVFGLLIGTYTSQKSVILVDVVGSEKLNSSFGILIFFQGLGTLIGPPLTGVFKDVFNSYADGFYFIGITTFMGALVLLISNTLKRDKSENSDDVQHQSV